MDETRRLRSLEDEDGRLKRRAVRGIVDDHVRTTAQACRALGLARPSYYRTNTGNAATRSVRREIAALS